MSNGPIDPIAFQARFQPDRLAVAELVSGRRWTFAALDRAIAQAAAVLGQHGIAIGDRVATLARNCAELLILQCACARIGALYVPLNWRLTAPEIAALVADVEPELIVGDDELLRVGLAGMSIDAMAGDIAAAEPKLPAPIDLDRPSLILFTSGTSGRPKGALLSERNLWATGTNLGRLANVSHDSRFLNDSPMFHIIGLVTNVRPALYHGGAVLISDGFDPARTLMRIADRDLAVTHYFCVPQMAAMLRHHADFDPAKMRGLTAIFTGGAPHPAQTIRAWLYDGIAMVDGYGMSEAGTVFGMPVDRALIAAKAGSVGLGTPALGVRIVDRDGNDCANDTAGEVLLKGESVFGGYWRQPEANKAAFTADGWFRTGDIAVRDDDGFYTLVDRKKDMFISGGENVYPAEIEAALAGFPGLAEVAVVGVADDRWGEVGHMALVPLPGMTVDADRIRAYLADRIARYKLPKYISLLDALPRTGSGKVVKADLRALLNAG